jgi:transposase
MPLELDNLPQDPDHLIAALRDYARVVEGLKSELDQVTAERNTALAEWQLAQHELDRLQVMIRTLQRMQFGRRSERLDPDQLQLGLEDLEQAAGTARAARERAGGSAQAPAPRRNRGHLPAHLPRVEVVLDVADKTCPCCGGTMHRIGEDRTEQRDIVPVRYRVQATVRPRYACRHCPDAGVVQAPERLLTGGLATEAMVASVAVAKYADHTPLYRQAQILTRQGLELDRSTLADWVGRAAWWLAPLRERLLGTVIGSPVIFADDTVVPVLDPGRGRTKTGRLWAYARDGRPWGDPTPPAVAYVYTEDRGGRHPTAHLESFRGVLQVDGYQSFDSLAAAHADGAVRVVNRWAHGRRKFHDLVKAQDSPIAREVVRRIAELYAIEAEIRGRGAEARRQVRHERTRPLVEDLKAYLEARLASVSGKSPLAGAIRYMLGRWAKLCVFLDDGRVEMDTNTVERLIRPVTLGRKNHLFAGSDAGGRTWATISSLVQTARLHDIDPFAYLTDVLERIVSGRTKVNDLDTLLPWAWKTNQNAQPTVNQ